MIKKILCLGNNDSSTDEMVQALAVANGTVNHGLIDQSNFTPTDFGYYHTTVVDLAVGEIIALSKHFDQIVLLDQPVELWSDKKLLFTTFKLFNDLSTNGCSTVYLQNKNVQGFLEFENFLKQNKSFCINPWINFVEDVEGIQLCARSPVLNNISGDSTDWLSNQERQLVRQKMLSGERIPEYCKTCYRYEDQGIESYRQFDTQEWVNQLGITSVDDLKKITHPYFYELRLSNKCNLMCRGCEPGFSHLILKEQKKFNIKNSSEAKSPVRKYSNIDRIDISKLDSSSRVYLTGGDPTVIPQVFSFMERCIDAGKTDFEYTLGTNAQKISDRFLNLCNHFSRLNFSVSIDGYGKVNDYWRWGSDFETVIKNTKMLQQHGHSISINLVPGIYNVTNLHLLYEFLDREFPMVSVYLQINYFEEQSPFNHPNVELALHSLERCKQTKMYYSNGKSNKSGIDSMYNHYKSNPKFDPQLLKRFFDANDQLDRARGSRLADYIPELEAVRHLVDK